MTSCPHAPSVVCLLQTLRQAIEAHGEITLRAADLGGLLGLTEFGSTEAGGDRVTLPPELDDAGWRSSLAHELLHVLRGPTTAEEAAAEELRVQQETGRLLFPAGELLSRGPESYTGERVQKMAARARVDVDVVEDALNPPTVPRLPAYRGACAGQ